MRITIISKFWPSDGRSGVGLMAADHATRLKSYGYIVTIIGSCATVENESILADNKIYIPAKGSGALYAPVKINKHLLEEKLLASKPDLVLIEAWQTAITDSSIDVAYKLGLPILMISHGISVHPYSWHPIDLLRSVAWLPYRFLKLPKRIKKLSGMTVLNTECNSPRFYDSYLARLAGIPIFKLVNTPINYFEKAVPLEKRKKQILLVGYFSRVKNQLRAIDIFSKMPADFTLCFIGKRSGKYFDDCTKKVKDAGLESRVIFMQDDECDLAEEIGNSMIVFSTSVTEVLPVVLLEAMASGTPFVAAPVGSISFLNGGVIGVTDYDLLNSLLMLSQDSVFWLKKSNDGILDYKNKFHGEIVGNQLNRAVTKVVKSSLPK